MDQEVQDMGFSEQVMLFGLASRSLKIWALGFGVRMSSVGSGKITSCGTVPTWL